MHIVIFYVVLLNHLLILPFFFFSELIGNPLGGHIMDIVNRPSSRIEDILCYLVDHHPGM